MKLALLGVDAAMLSVVRAAAEQGEHTLVAAIEAGTAGDFLRQLWPHVQLRDDWEFLLAPGSVDAVLVARAVDEESRVEQLRKLVQAGLPLLVSHPACESMLLYYELDMIRRESGCRLMPCLPARWHPAMARLEQLIDDPAAGIGRLEQLAIERTLAARDRSTVTSQFAVDIDLARTLAGELTQLSALAPGSEETRYANLGVQLSGPRDVAVRWSVRPGDSASGARLTLLGSAGRAELAMPVDGEWLLEFQHGEQQTRQSFPTWDAAGEALARLERVAVGEDMAPTWLDACRSVELAETIARSLKRGRTIELHYEDFSEQSTFKGMMTSLGCGLLVAALFIMLLAAVGGRLGLPFARHWVTLLLLLLGLFLALQALRLVFPRKD
jgi:myo-inositol 2-dehydrogenase/D-chiro-inositol 1-dehydrogenase